MRFLLILVSVPGMMYGFGDSASPLHDTVELVEVRKRGRFVPIHSSGLNCTLLLKSTALCFCTLWNGILWTTCNLIYLLFACLTNFYLFAQDIIFEYVSSLLHRAMGTAAMRGKLKYEDFVWQVRDVRTIKTSSWLCSSACSVVYLLTIYWRAIVCHTFALLLGLLYNWWKLISC